ncbi:DUF4097 domain-containing protein [Fructobacillus sp. M2-14]|uniref:DUF4097 domain-containing protein n=1 Tax=Fructobacillus broussonetiae TaxID=2713173 RepID=A0ABS5R2N0_9LACO|nr:DUF4097 family beta strand repeat-containing protein [Fructobacillus broussonetiae]MBS9338412.1 DUF4097 domain-containing protein [Fructobacillus broussonetiae]
MSRKIWVGLTLVVLGLVMSGIAYSQEGIPGRIYWNAGPVYLSDKEDKAQADVTPDAVASMKQTVKKVQVSSKNADITVKKGEHFAVIVDRPEKPYLTISATDGVVKVTGEEHVDWSLGVGNAGNHHITVYVPSDVTLEQLDLVNLNGDIKVDNVKVEELLLQNSAGDTTVTNSKVNQSGFSLNRFGDITFRKTALPKVKAFSRFGDLNISSSYQNVPAKDAAFSFSNNGGDITLQ